MTGGLSLADVMGIYKGSDGDATRALYARLERCGLIGHVAVNLFRACKASERAKVYRGGQRGKGSFRRMAYDRKGWAIDNLCDALRTHAPLDLVWGWGKDSGTDGFDDVLFIDLPTGQVSFHSPGRGFGPDYPGAWDGIRGQSATRICCWCFDLLQASAE